MLDGELPHGLNGVKQRIALLLTDHATEQEAQRSNVAAQRQRLELGVGTRELGETLHLIVRMPQRVVSDHKTHEVSARRKPADGTRELPVRVSLDIGTATALTVTGAASSGRTAGVRAR